MEETPEFTASTLDAISERIISQAFKALFELHLYQSVKVGVPKFPDGGVSPPQLKAIKEGLERCVGDWRLRGDMDTVGTMGGYGARLLRVHLTHANFLCQHSSCRRERAFKPLSTEEVSLRGHRTSADAPGDLQQAWIITLQCQSCLTGPVVMMVSRKGERITLCGRTPVDAGPEVPEAPEVAAPYMSEAEMAYRCKKVLPAIFMLRVAVEQYAKQVVDANDPTAAEKFDKTDQYMEAYTKLLPEPLKEMFGTLSDVYKRLSEKMHSADPCETTYLWCQKRMIGHFRGLAASRDASEAPESAS